MVLFAVLTVTPAVLPHFGWFVAVRLATGALQGLFLAAAFSTVAALVPQERVGRALGTVIAGFSISTVVGLPLGVLVGAVLGWRGGLLMTGGVGLLAAGVVFADGPGVGGSGLSLLSDVRHAVGPPVVAMRALRLPLFASRGGVMSVLVPVF